MLFYIMSYFKCRESRTIEFALEFEFEFEFRLQNSRIFSEPEQRGGQYRRVLADVIVYIFAHLHTALRAEGNMLDIN